MEPPAAIVLHWNQIWAVMEAWDRVSDSSAMRERLMAADPPPKRAKLAANAVTTATPDTFDFTPRETASPRSMPHATRSPRIFSFSKLQAHTGAAIEALSEAASPQLSVPHAHSFARPVTASTPARLPRIFSFSKPRVHADGATEAPSETASPQPLVPRAAPSPRIFSFSKPRAHADGATEAPSGAGSVREREAATVFSFTSAPTQAPVQHGRAPSPRIYSFAQPRVVAPPACAEPFRFSATTTLAPVPGPAFTFSAPPPKMVAKARVSRRQLRLAASYDWSTGRQV